MLISRLISKFVALIPGRDTFGIYRTLPFFFLAGACLEYTMIKWQPKGHNFYTTYTKNQIERAAQKQVRYEDMRDWVKLEQQQRKQNSQE